LLQNVRFDDAGVDDICDVLFGLFFEQYLADEILLAGAEKFSFDERVPFVERGKVHLQLWCGCRSVDNQLAFLLGAGNELFLGLRKAVRVRTENKTKKKKSHCQLFHESSAAAELLKLG